MHDITEYLSLVVEKNASDLHLTVGKPPTIRLHGDLIEINDKPLTPEDTEALMKSITSETHQARLAEVGGSDFGFAFGDLARFRVSIFKQKGYIGLVLRLIPNKLLTFEEIGLPPGIRELLYRPRGLILVVGPTGSGKTTTLATMIDYINSNRGDVHIVTIEDPIEYYHEHKKAIVMQREIGVDVPSFSEALTRVLRQDPDVILVGEMRDLATIEAAITAAETGHLVFATLHTTGAARTMDRIIDVFPTHQQDQIRTQLSVSIVAVISQLLLRRADRPGRVAAFEIMVGTPAIGNLIREKKTHRITSAIQTGTKLGMLTLDQSLFNLYVQGKISYDDLMSKCNEPEEIQKRLADLEG